MFEVTEMKLEVRKFNCVILSECPRGVATTKVVPVVVVYAAVTDRMFVSDGAVRVLGVGR